MKINENILINIVIIVFTIAFQRVITSFDLAKDLAVLTQRVVELEKQIESIKRR